MNITGRRRLTIALAACLAAAPTALAGPLYDPGGSSAGRTAAPTQRSVDRGAQPSTSTTTPNLATRPIVRLDGWHSIPAGTAPTVISVGSSGFDWNDAGIGFGAASGLALLAGGSLLAARRFRHPRPPLI